MDYRAWDLDTKKYYDVAEIVMDTTDSNFTLNGILVTTEINAKDTSDVDGETLRSGNVSVHNKDFKLPTIPGKIVAVKVYQDDCDDLLTLTNFDLQASTDEYDYFDKKHIFEGDVVEDIEVDDDSMYLVVKGAINDSEFGLIKLDKDVVSCLALGVDNVTDAQLSVIPLCVEELDQYKVLGNMYEDIYLLIKEFTEDFVKEIQAQTKPKSAKETTEEDTMGNGNGNDNLEYLTLNGLTKKLLQLELHKGSPIQVDISHYLSHTEIRLQDDTGLCYDINISEEIVNYVNGNIDVSYLELAKLINQYATTPLEQRGAISTFSTRFTGDNHEI